MVRPDIPQCDVASTWIERFCSKQRRWILAAGMFVLTLEAVVAVCFRENDFLWHYKTGEAFLSGDPYAVVPRHYLPSRMFFNGGLALLGHRAARAACCLATMAIIFWLARRWSEMAETSSAPRTRSVSFAALTLTGVILYPYIIRDLDDCGIHLFFLFLLSAGGYAMWRNRRTEAGLWLGAAAAYKITALLFLPYLLWKREGRAALAMSLALVGLNLAPALYLGWEKNWSDLAACVSFMRGQSNNHDPSQNGVEPPRHQNQSLPFAIARYLQTHEPGEALYLDHPWFVQFGRLSPEQSRLATRGILLAIACALAWRYRGAWRSDGRLTGLPAEWASVCIFVAILSPLCWLQHLVLMFPSVFLSARDWIAGGATRNPRAAALAAIAFIALVLQRDVVQRDLSILVLSYKLDTLAALVAATLVLTTPSAMEADSTESLSPPSGLKQAA